MKVHELIAKLQKLPQNSEVMFSAPLANANADIIPNPEQVWDDDAENYVVVL